jgi:hypothetical protein
MARIPPRLAPRLAVSKRVRFRNKHKTTGAVMKKGRVTRAVAVSALAAVAITAGAGHEAHAGGLVCRKVVAPAASGEKRNALNASRVRCADDEMLTGGSCYPEVRTEDDGTCQTSAMAIIQTLAENPGTTRGAFYTCLQTGGTDCAVEERTRAMAICCKIEAEDDAKAKEKAASTNDAGSAEKPKAAGQ